MKLKYKRIVLLITMSTMSIGFVTLSLSTPSVKLSTKVEQESESTETVTKDIVVPETEDPSEEIITPVSSETESVADKKEEIEELVGQYFQASVENNMDAMKKLVSNIKHVDQDMLAARNEYIQKYKNIECYVMDGPTEGTYCVYVYSELKIVDIDTLAPGLVGLYVTTSDDDKLQVYLDTLDEKTQVFINDMNQSEEVKGLSEKVNKKLEEAVSSDADLKEFYDKLAGASKESTKEETKEKEKTKANKKDTQKAAE